MFFHVDILPKYSSTIIDFALYGKFQKYKSNKLKNIYIYIYHDDSIDCPIKLGSSRGNLRSALLHAPRERKRERLERNGKGEKAFFWSFSSPGLRSTHAEDLIRSIGRADLIANTRNRGNARTERERETFHVFCYRDNGRSPPVS